MLSGGGDVVTKHPHLVPGAASAGVKRKFGDAVRSTSPEGQTNEVLCKVLAHNLCVLMQAAEEFGIDCWEEAEPTPLAYAARA